MLAVLGMAMVNKQFFPTSDRPEVLVEVQLPYGSAIEQTSAATAKVEAWLAKQAEARIVTAYIGQGAPRFFLAMAPELPDPSFAKIVVLAGNDKEREALKLRLRQAVADSAAASNNRRNGALDPRVSPRVGWPDERGVGVEDMRISRVRRRGFQARQAWAGPTVAAQLTDLSRLRV